MRSKHQTKLLVIQGLLALILGLFTVLKSRGAPVFIFWPIFCTLILVSLFIVLTSDKSHKLISLVILELALCSVYTLSIPHTYQLGRDVYFESGFASTITEEGLWNPGLGTGFAENYYGYNPTLHFMLAFLSSITGIATPALSKYLIFPALRVLLVLSAVMLISLFIRKEKERIVYLAAFIFLSSFGMSFMEVSRRLIADIFLMLSLYSLIRGSTEQRRKIWDIMFYLFSAMVIISNHSVAYILMVLLAGIWLFWAAFRAGLFGKRFMSTEFQDDRYSGIFKKLAIVFCMFLAWEAATSFVLLKNDLLYLGALTGIFVNGEGLRLLIGSGSPVASPFIYRWYETGTLYLYHIMFVLIGFMGLFYYTKRLLREPSNEMRAAHRALLLFMGFTSLAMYILAFTLIKTQLDSAAYTFLWLFCIPISIFIAYFVDYLYVRAVAKKGLIIFLAIFSILLFAGHIFSGIYTPRLISREPAENIVLGTDMRAKIPELYYSAEWLSMNAAPGSKLLGDMEVFEMYSGLFGFDVSTDTYNLEKAYGGTPSQLEEVLSDVKVYFGSYMHTYHYDQADYLIIDQRFYSLPSYLYENPLNRLESRKFDNTSSESKMYDNGIIIIYQNLKSNS